VVFVAGGRVGALGVGPGLSLDRVVGVAVEGRLARGRKAGVLSHWYPGRERALAGLVGLAAVLGVAVGDGDIGAGMAISRSSDPPGLLMAEPP
jgi:hypothetical protein